MGDLVTSLLNLVVPPALLLFLFLLYPLFIIYKILLFIFNSIYREDVRNKVVIITGASSGIGEELAYQYAMRGANLVLVARREQRLHEVAHKARSMGSPHVLVIPGDVSKADDCKRFIDETITHFGRLDHLVNNAGIGCFCLIEEIEDISQFSQVMDMNFWGSVYPTYFAIPHLRESRGKIVVNSSVAGWFPLSKKCIYNATKAAMINFYETLRLECGSEIKITIATHGWVDSEITRGKFLGASGKMTVNKEIIDDIIGPLPLANTDKCAEAMVKSACRGQRYVTYPTWYNVLFLYRVLVPEFVEWWYGSFLSTKPTLHQSHAPSKKSLEEIGTKKFQYPTILHSPGAKSD